MKTLFFFGDSITLGVNDVLAGGWVGRFAGLACGAGLPVPPSTFYNLGVRKHSSRQIRDRWRSEYQCRINPASVPFLIFCFGTVDMAAPNGEPVVPMMESLENTKAILLEASREAPVLLMSPPPVTNPDHQARIAELVMAQARLCAEYAIPYLNLQEALPPVFLADLDDGLHPGAAGNRLIAEKLLDEPALHEWITS